MEAEAEGETGTMVREIYFLRCGAQGAENNADVHVQEYDENMLDFDLGEVDMDALFGSVDGKSYFLVD